MLVACVACDAEFSLPDSIPMPGTGTLLRCPRCGQKNRLFPGGVMVLESLGSGPQVHAPEASRLRSEIDEDVETAESGLCPVVDGVALGRNPQGFEEWRNKKDGSVLVLIPGATFTMGSTQLSDERPPHAVTLLPFGMGKYPVTNAQFRRFVSASHYDASGNWKGPASRWGEDAPVVAVSWHDARAYCAWAELRLPTEAEWELAARGLEGHEFPWGVEFNASRCQSSVGLGWGGAKGPVPVDSFPSGASPFGCLDMAGNAWEWCSSKKSPYPYDFSDGREDPGGEEGRVVRGGSWYIMYMNYFRGAYRGRRDPDIRNNLLCFRICKTLVPPLAI